MSGGGGGTGSRGRSGWIARLIRSRRRAEADVDDELSFHIEGRLQQLVEAGWEPEEARAEVLGTFGDPKQIAEECRRIDRERMHREERGERMAQVAMDVRYALRTLRKNPGFAAVAILTLGLGMGATTAIFSVVDAVVFRPLPFPDPDRLVVVWEANLAQGLEQDAPSPPNYTDWRHRNRTFVDLAAMYDGSLTLTGMDQPEMLSSAFVSANFFDVLGASPMLGRGFVEGEDQADGNPPVVVSAGLWQRLLASTPELAGETLELNGQTVDVIGVMPEWFAIPRREVELWIPEWQENPQLHRQSRYLNVVGRLNDEVGLAAAKADLDAIQREIAVDFPLANEGWTVQIVPAHDELVGSTRGTLLVLLGAVGFVLLIACANVANLLIGRAAHREREISVRSALGAAGGRIRRQLVTESVTLGVLGGALGVLLAYQGVRLFVALEPLDLPRIDEVAVDLRVLVFALFVSVGTGIVFGLAPAMRASRGRLAQGLRESRSGSLGTDRTRRALVIAEVAVSLVLLVGAGLLVQSFSALRTVETGFDPDGVTVARVTLPAAGYPTNADRLLYFDEALRHLEEHPAVRSAGITSTLPVDPAGIDFDLTYRAEGQPSLPPEQLDQIDYRIASSGYFEAMGIAVVRGRAFSSLDRAETRRVLIVNESFAQTHWPGEDAVGRTVDIYYVAEPYLTWEVVGVVEDTRHTSLSTPGAPQMFVPLTQAEFLFGYMQIAARGVPGSNVADALRQATLAVDPGLPLHEVATLDQRLSESLAQERFAAWLLTGFAAVALILAACGIYGVVSYQVARRGREIGLRMALGARRASVVRRVVAETFGTAVIGVVLGIGGAMLAGRGLGSLLYEVDPADPMTLTGMGVALLSVACAAALVPALRAAFSDPARALRTD